MIFSGLSQTALYWIVQKLNGPLNETLIYIPANLFWFTLLESRISSASCFGAQPEFQSENDSLVFLFDAPTQFPQESPDRPGVGKESTSFGGSGQVETRHRSRPRPHFARSRWILVHTSHGTLFRIFGLHLWCSQRYILASFPLSLSHFFLLLVCFSTLLWFSSNLNY